MTIVALLYFFLSPRCFEALYRSKIFHPEPLSDEDGAVSLVNGVQGKEVFFSSKNGKILNGRYYQNASGAKLALCSHGNRGNLSGWDTRTECLLKAGFSVFVYDYQGFGRSQGSARINRSCQDAVAAFDFACLNLGYQPTDIVLYGASLGGGITCELARVRHCAAVILQSTFTSFDKISREVSALGKVYPAALSIQPSLNNRKLVKKMSAPLLVLHGKIDGYIRLRHGEELYAAAGSQMKRLVVFPHEGHPNFGSRDTDLLTQTLTEFRLMLG